MISDLSCVLNCGNDVLLVSIVVMLLPTGCLVHARHAEHIA